MTQMINDNEDHPMEKKSRDSSFSEDIFKAQQGGTWATLGMSDRLVAALHP